MRNINCIAITVLINSYTINAVGEYLVISFTKESEFLGPFVHKNTVKLTIIHSSYFNGFRSPTHDMRITDNSWNKKYDTVTTRNQQSWQGTGTVSLWRLLHDPKMSIINQLHKSNHYNSIQTTCNLLTNWCRSLSPL